MKRKVALTKIGLSILLALLGLALVTKEYLGFHYYYQYKAQRQAARSIEQVFSSLEKNLSRARRFSQQPLFYQELGRLYLEMAMAENEFGSAARRDEFLLRAEESLKQQIEANPVDSRAFYNLGKVYLLFNFPLLTYADKGRPCLRRALELKPADEFLNLNIIYIYLAQWELLNSEDREFLARQLSFIEARTPDFKDRLRRRWRENFPSTDLLEERLAFLSSFNSSLRSPTK